MSEISTLAVRTAEIVNPVIAATTSTFEMMAGVSLKRTELQAFDRMTSLHEISAIVQLSGDPRGSICLSIERRAAFALVRVMLDSVVHEVNSLVLDTVGEFANVVAGSTSSSLSDLDLRLGLPSIVQGTRHQISFPPGSVPMAAHFTSPLGRIMVAFAFISGIDE